MKRICGTALAFALAASVFAAPASAAVKISKTSATLKVGQTLRLKVTGTKKTPTWKSSAKKIAAVSGKGVVTARKAGKATITAKVGKKKLKCVVTVKKAPKAKSLKLSASSAKLTKGGTLTLKATVSPANAADKRVKWTTSDAKVATVSGKGVVKAVGKGKATIAASCRANPKIRKTCSVTVTEKRKASLSISASSSKALRPGGTVQIKATVSPAGAVKTLKWKSDSPKTATVNGKGLVTAIAPGTARITVSDGDGLGLSASVTLTVEKPEAKLTGIEVSCLKKSFDKDYSPKATDFKTVGTYSDGTRKEIPASYSFRKTLKTDLNGNGGGTVTATASAGGFSKTLEIPVTPYSAPQTKPKAETVGIEASTALKEAASAQEAVDAEYVVNGILSDGTKSRISSYAVKAAYDSSSKDYAVTITTTDGKFSCVVRIPKKAETQKTIESIRATTTRTDAATLDEALSGPFEVFAEYSDGTENALKTYSLSAKYDQASGKYAVTVTAENGKFKAVVYVPKKNGGTDVSSSSSGTGGASEKKERKVVGIEASCRRTELEPGEKLTADDFSVYDVYDDGKKEQAAAEISLRYGTDKCVAAVKASGFEKTLEIRINRPEPETEDPSQVLTNLKVKASPGYVYVGEGLAEGQLVVTGIYKDGSERPVYDYACGFAPRSGAGTFSFDVSYGGITCVMTMEARNREKVLESVEAECLRSRFYSDETPTKEMFSMTAEYADGSRQAVTDFDLSYVPASEHKGTSKAVLSWKGRSLTLEIPYYVATEPESVDFAYIPNPIPVGAELNRNDLTVTATDFRGNETIASDFETDFSPKSEPGIYGFSVSYKGFSGSFEAQVAE